MSQKNRKGQLTAFIIIGILLLFSSFLIYYIKNKSVNIKPDRLEGEFSVVQEFVTQCLEEVGEEAVILIGQHGGYISVEQPKITGKGFKRSRISTESDVVFISENSAVPYWWYLESHVNCKNCLLTTKNVPTLREMEIQISKYSEEQLELCLDNFSEFSARGIMVEHSARSRVTTEITKNKVLLKLYMPLRIKKGESVVSASNFIYEINLNLLEFYQLALEITKKEQDEQFLETAVMHLVTSYSGLDDTKLPPISAFTTGPRVVRWQKQSIAERLADLLSTHMPLLQVENTLGAQRLVTQSSILQGLYNVLFIENSASYKSLEVRFLFNSKDLYMDITPDKQGMLSPTIVRQEFPFGLAPSIQTNNYEFFYDISFPVIVEIWDKNGLDGRGYSFLFALEANIRDNKNLVEWHKGNGTIGPWDTDSLKIITTNPSTARLPGETTPSINITTLEKNMFCDYDQRLSGEVLISTTDRLTNKPIEDTSIIYGCGNYAACLIGTTDSEGFFKGRLPICIGGYLQLEKEGYLTTRVVNISTLYNVSGDYTLRLYPLKRLKLEAAVLDYMENGLGAETRLEPYETAIVTVRRQDVFDEQPQQSFIIEKGVYSEILLAPGNYNIQATLVDSKGVVIDEHSETILGQFIKYPRFNITPRNAGGVILNEESGQWTVTEQDLKSNYIKVFLIRMPYPKSVNELIQSADLEYLSKKNRYYLEPKFS
ncbi:MAG: hypothetical protein QXK37_03905 [Candidatus Woesearchaeota archaeon]